MKKILFLLLVVGLFFACKKDKLGSKPSISFNSFDPPSADSNTQQLNVTFNVKDGDGDIENFIGWKIHYNQPPPTPPTDSFTRTQMPNIGANQGNKVNAQVTLQMQTNWFRLWNEDHGAAPDSLWLTVFILDNAGNSSDTINTPKIPIHKRRVD